MNRYYKNFILCGDMDQYCLLCKETFHLIPEIEKHVRWEKHRKNAKEQTFLSHYEADLIYKIQTNYYCATCNTIMRNMAGVKKHIKTENHCLLKAKPDAIIKKPAGLLNDGHVIINKVILNKLQWNSIIDNICHLCNQNLEKIDEHIASEEHMIRLILSQTKYTDEQYYRKISEEMYHCFTCKKMFAATNFEDHWTQCENFDDVQIKKLKESQSKNIQPSGSGTSSSDMREKDVAKIERDLADALHEFYTIDDEKNIAVCRFCYKVLGIDFKAMLQHMKASHNMHEPSVSPDGPIDEKFYNTVPDNGARRMKLAKLGDNLYIKLNHNGSQGYCKFCDKYISAHKFQFKLHCCGLAHRGYLEVMGLVKHELRETSAQYAKIDFKSFVKSVENSTTEAAFWINSQLRINIDSFFFIYTIRGDPHYKRLKCHACSDVMRLNDVVAHCLTLKHRVLFGTAKLISKEGEFIREVRPYLYHCGFCNRTFPFSKLLEDHLRTRNHILLKEKKTLVTNVANIIRTLNPNPIDVSATDDDLYHQMLGIAGNITRTNL